MAAKTKKKKKTRGKTKKAGDGAKAPSAAERFRRRLVEAPETPFGEAFEQWGDGLAETSARVVYLNTRATLKLLHDSGRLKR